jgi:hypothetical protein
MAELMTTLFLTLCLSPASASSFRAQTLHLSIEVTAGEHSMDSNSTTTSVLVNGERMTYARSYHGRRGKGQKDFSKEITLRASERDAIAHLLKRQNLLGSRTVDYPINGPGSYFSFEMHAVFGKSKGSIKVSGAMNTLRDEQLYKDVTALLQNIESVVDSR